jgi:hypothetical protein
VDVLDVQNDIELAVDIDDGTFAERAGGNLHRAVSSWTRNSHDDALPSAR